MNCYSEFWLVIWLFDSTTTDNLTLNKYIHTHACTHIQMYSTHVRMSVVSLYQWHIHVYWWMSTFWYLITNWLPVVTYDLSTLWLSHPLGFKFDFPNQSTNLLCGNTDSRNHIFRKKSRTSRLHKTAHTWRLYIKLCMASTWTSINTKGRKLSTYTWYIHVHTVMHTVMQYLLQFTLLKNDLQCTIWKANCDIRHSRNIHIYI